ncbi:hypothetical protein ACI2KE_15275 [Pseudomonas monteilii]|uniref:DUF7716 domain-containing protein n=1 Tax=Pseudomonas alabamensis TaxID=3064349 RepID=UPI000745C0F9|nr:hypothetical protein [Pseudomonas entomophila]AMA45747.1 hypothetical protein APT63_08960 [Pseudomonas monteilii]
MSTSDKGEIMQTFNGFEALLRHVDRLPETGWIFVEGNGDFESPSSIMAATYYLADTEVEEITLEKSKRTFVEAPTLQDIVSTLDLRPTTQQVSDYIEAVIYYRVNDDFLD